MKSKIIERILEVVQTSQLTDIYQIGLADVDSNEIELIPNHEVLFLEFGSNYLKLESINQSSHLRITETQAISFANLSLDEGLSPYKVSIDELILTDIDLNNTVITIDLYGFIDDDSKGLICEAVSLRLYCGQEIFFDPSFYWGINMGGESQKEKWFENYPNDNNKIAIDSFRF